MDIEQAIQESGERMLKYFVFKHLPVMLQGASKPFADLAMKIVETIPASAERTVALRKLLEAKDCAVRASLG
jgi:hypothetical protein